MKVGSSSVVSSLPCCPQCVCEGEEHTCALAARVAVSEQCPSSLKCGPYRALTDGCDPPALASAMLPCAAYAACACISPARSLIVCLSALFLSARTPRERDCVSLLGAEMSWRSGCRVQYIRMCVGIERDTLTHTACPPPLIYSGGYARACVRVCVCVGVLVPNGRLLPSGVSSGQSVEVFLL